jgi:hypothetical protein
MKDDTRATIASIQEEISLLQLCLVDYSKWLEDYGKWLKTISKQLEEIEKKVKP